MASSQVGTGGSARSAGAFDDADRAVSASVVCVVQYLLVHRLAPSSDPHPC